MKYDIYPVEASDSFSRFEFISKGPKGHIRKLIAYKKCEGFSNVYNLGFGDIVENGVDDIVVTNNGDSKKVLQTVASTITKFFKAHETAIVLIMGNTVVKNRLYRMMISHNLKLFEDEFDVLGLVGENFYSLKENIIYDGFMIQKKNTLHL